MSTSIKNISEELRKKNLDNERNDKKGKELIDLNSGENNQYIKRAVTNCAYFVKTGKCRFGSSCRFIHPEKKLVKIWNPLKTGQIWNPLKTGQVHGEDQQQAGRPICRYYLSPVGCVHGNTCQFVHHQNKVDVGLNKSSSADSQVLPHRRIPFPVPYYIPFPDKFNIAVGPTGLPLRTGRPVCKYYSHFGLCKYGIACQDDHPIDLKSVAVPLTQRSFKHRNHN